MKNLLLSIAITLATITSLKAENDLLKILNTIGGNKTTKSSESEDDTGTRKSNSRYEKLPKGIAIRCKIVTQATQTGDEIYAFTLNDVTNANGKVIFPAGSEVFGKVENLTRGRVYVSNEWKLMTKKNTYRFTAVAGEVRMNNDETSFDLKSFRQGLRLSRNDTLEIGQEFVLTNE